MMQRIKFYLKPLVNEILDQLPPEVFISDTTTFLDPALGGGQFLREVIKRLRASGHSDENIRSRIWGCEIRELRLKYAVRFGGVISDHLITSDFLSYDWGNMKFDVILGNPPYQIERNNTRLGSRGDSALWPKFVHKSLSLIKPKGFMCMVHPTSWRKPDERYGLWTKLTKENTMKKLVMRSGKGPQDIFGIGIRVDWYVVQNDHANPGTFTQVIDHEDITHSLDLSTWAWLPNYSIDDIKEMLGSGCDVVYNTQYHTQKEHSLKPSKKFKWPVVHTINKDGLGFRYFDKAEVPGIVHFGKPKVLLNQNEIQYPYNDHKGEYGMSQLTFGIGIQNKKEGDAIVDFLNSPKGKRIIAATKWNTFYTDYGMFKYFKRDWYNV